MERTYERVLVPLDGSETAEAILPFAERLAGPLSAELVLVRVVEPLSAAEARAAAGARLTDAALAREIDARQYLAGVAARIAARGLKVRTELRAGPPAGEILAATAALGADLIAMSTHGRGGMARLVVGSVAEAVLRGTRVPALLVRAGAGPQPGGAARREDAR